MSAVIPNTKTMSDLLKPTGFNCPDNLQGKTFEEATSVGGIPEFDKIEALKWSNSSGGIVTSEVLDPSSYKTLRILVSESAQELTRYEDGKLDTDHSALTPSSSVTAQTSSASATVSLETSVMPTQTNLGRETVGLRYNMGDFYLDRNIYSAKYDLGIKISEDLSKWTDISANFSAEAQEILGIKAELLFIERGVLLAFSSSGAYVHCRITKEGGVQETFGTLPEGASSISALNSSFQNDYAIVGWVSNGNLQVCAIKIDLTETLIQTDLISCSDVSDIALLYTPAAWLLSNSSSKSITQFTGEIGSLIEAGTITPPTTSTAWSLIYLNDTLIAFFPSIKYIYSSTDMGAGWTKHSISLFPAEGIYYLPKIDLYIIYNSDAGGIFSKDLSTWGDAQIPKSALMLAQTLDGKGLVTDAHTEYDSYLITYDSGYYAKVVTQTASSNMPSLVILGEKK